MGVRGIKVRQSDPYVSDSSPQEEVSSLFVVDYISERPRYPSRDKDRDPSRLRLSEHGVVHCGVVPTPENWK